MNKRKNTKNNSTKIMVSKSKGYIDAENVSAKQNDILNKKMHSNHATAYTLENDHRTKRWDRIAHENNNITSKKLSGPRTRNKVDKAIMNDMINDANKGTKKQFLVTSDGDYADTVRNLKNKGVNIIVLGEKKAPKKLRKAASKFIEI